MKFKVPKQSDKHYFKHTAKQTKKVNVVPYVSRGGIRL